MAARVIEIVDAVVAYIRANQEPTNGATVERRVPPDTQVERAYYENLVGRWVYVFPTRKRFTNEGRTRGRRAQVFDVSVVVAERVPTDYRTEPERRAWADTVVEWVEDTIHAPLTDETTLDLIAGAAIHPTEAAGIVDLVNPGAWAEGRLFWSEVQLAFWEG